MMKWLAELPDQQGSADSAMGEQNRPPQLRT
jgi:hypothetical protein